MLLLFRLFRLICILAVPVLGLLFPETLVSTALLLLLLLLHPINPVMQRELKSQLWWVILDPSVGRLSQSSLHWQCLCL